MYKNCNLILHGICFFADKMVSCCYSPVTENGNQSPPVLFDNYKGEIIPADELFKKMHSYSEIFKSGSCPKNCAECCFIEEKDWDESRYINEITIAHFAACNAQCIYCANNLSRYNVKYEPYPVLPVLKYYKDCCIIRKGVEFHISGGEFSIYKECDALMEEFGITNYAKIIISSNCIRYSDAVKKSIDAGSTYIVNSLDSGSRELFKKIKGIDAFDNVVSNLKNYAVSIDGRNHITLKYIIIPSINDNIKEFKKFLDTAESIGTKNIVIEIEGCYTRKLDNKIDSYFIYLAEEMKELALKRGFAPQYYAFLKQSMLNIKYKKSNFVSGVTAPLSIISFITGMIL